MYLLGAQVAILIYNQNNRVFKNIYVIASLASIYRDTESVNSQMLLSRRLKLGCPQ